MSNFAYTPRFDGIHTDFDTSLGKETEAWAAWKYGQKFPHLWEKDHGNNEVLGEEFEHLLFKETVTTTTAALNGACVSWVRARQPHRKGRKHICNRGQIVIRRKRANTHRQMDNVWLAEMVTSTSAHESALADSCADFLDDAEVHLEEINEELWEEYEYQLLLTEQHWKWHHSGPMTEAMQNCHGYNGRDPVEEEIECMNAFEEHLMYDQFDQIFNDFWGVEHYDNYPEDEADGDYYDDWPELRITPEEWDAVEDAELAEERTAEAAAEALELEFEHLAAGNAVGRRMQLAARAA